MSSFGGTVKLTGESDYRKALSEISSNLKVLNSEMKNVTSQYDKNDKSVENLSSQNEVLNKKIAEQENKVSILKEALAKSAEETGENSEKTKKWQTELNNAQAELNTLNRKVDENAKAMKDAEQGTKEEADAVEDFGNEADKSGEKALSLGDIIKANLISDAIKGGFTALVDGFKAVGSAMGECLTDGAAYADTLITLSAQTGLSTDTLEKYNAVAELADVSMDTFTGSLAKTTKAMGEAQKGSTKYVEAYEKLGVSVTDANGNLRDSEDVYWETVDALKGIENETERDAMAMELFGKSAQDLNTIIDMGSEGFKELEQSAVDMGAVLGGEGLQALGALDDQMQIFSSTTSATKNILASAFAPAMSGAMESVNNLGGAFNGLLSAIISGNEDAISGSTTIVFEYLWDIIYGIEDMIAPLTELIGEILNVVINILVEALPDILEQGANLLSTLLSGISQSLPSILPVIMSVIQTLLTTIMNNLPLLIKMGIEMLTSLINGIANMLPELIPMAIDCVVTIVETLLDNIDLIIDAAINIIMALADGLLKALPDLVDKIPTIIDKLVTAIFDNFPKILDAGVKLIIQLAVGLVQAIPQLMSRLPEITAKIINGLLGAIPQLIKAGGDLLAGLFKGMLNPETIWNSVKSLFKGIIGGIKELFGIHSPSKVFEDEVGKNLALGLGEGFEDTMSDVTDEMASAIPTEFDADINTNMKMASGSQMSTYDMMVSAFEQALSNVKVVMDDREMGVFVTDVVERTVYA